MIPLQKIFQQGWVSWKLADRETFFILGVNKILLKICFLTDLAKIRYRRSPLNAVYHFCDFRENRRSRRFVTLRAHIQLHWLVYLETVWHSDSKGRLGKLCVLRHGEHHAQSCLWCSQYLWSTRRCTRSQLLTILVFITVACDRQKQR